MRTWGLAGAIGAVLTVFVALLLACGPSETSSFCAGKSCSSADAGLDGDSTMSLLGADHGAPQTITITPANSTLAVTDLSNLPSETLSATLTYTDGTTASVQASWTVDRYDIASIGAGNGLVQPTGNVFGKVTVTAVAQGIQGSTTVTVTVQATINQSNLPAGDAAKLAAAVEADPAVTVLAYPYDKTVFPTGLVPPEMMWNLGSAGDEYEIHLVAPSLDLAVLTTADPPSRFTLTQAIWNTFVGTAAGGDATVELRRLSNGVAYLSVTQTWTIANADVRGLVYFWNVSQGQLLKADLTVGQVYPVFPPSSGQPGSNSDPTGCGTLPCESGNPRALFPEGGAFDTPPWEDNGAGNRCVACHSVSKDGSTLAATFATGGSAGPIGTIDLATTGINTIGNYFENGMFTAITPDGSLAVVNTADEHMHLVDAKTGVQLPSQLDSLSNVCDPAFSPDGTLFALATNCGGQPTGDSGTPTTFVLEFASSNLVVYQFFEATGIFQNPQTLVTSGQAGQSAFAFPSFSPDSKWLFFQGGNYSRAKYGACLATDPTTCEHGSDDLYVVSTTPGSTPVSLDETNAAGVQSAGSLHLNYAPTVNPIVSGGYIWVVFTSPRDYGNLMVAPYPVQPPPNDTTYINHKQLWVAAIDANIGQVDPSHPPFWLPGQDMTTANMFGYWTLAPCKPTPGDGGAPATCATGFECCSGFCRNEGQGLVCVNNPGGCSQIGEMCTATSDCCGAGGNVSCLAGVCQNVAN
jgi:hypothetical protein